MTGPLEWYAAVTGVIAAFMIAGDFGRKVTGWGFLLFSTGSVAWIASSLQADPPAIPLAAQNGVLLLVNIFGLWQYWLSPKNRKKIEVSDKAIGRAEARGEI